MCKFNKNNNGEKMKFTKFRTVKLFTVIFAVMVTALMLTSCGKSKSGSGGGLGGDLIKDAAYLSKDIADYTEADWRDLANNQIYFAEQSIPILEELVKSALLFAEQADELEKKYGNMLMLSPEFQAFMSLTAEVTAKSVALGEEVTKYWPPSTPTNEMPLKEGEQGWEHLTPKQQKRITEQKARVEELEAAIAAAP